MPVTAIGRRPMESGPARDDSPSVVPASKSFRSTRAGSDTDPLLRRLHQFNLRCVTSYDSFETMAPFCNLNGPIFPGGRL